MEVAETIYADKNKCWERVSSILTSRPKQLFIVYIAKHVLNVPPKQE